MPSLPFKNKTLIIKAENCTETDIKISGSLLILLDLKVGLSPSKKKCVICFIESPDDEKYFLFHLKSLFRSQDIQVFVMIFWPCRNNDLIR